MSGRPNPRCTRPGRRVACRIVWARHAGPAGELLVRLTYSQRQSVYGPIMADPELDPVDLHGLSEGEVRRLLDEDLLSIESLVRNEYIRRHG